MSAEAYELINYSLRPDVAAQELGFSVVCQRKSGGQEKSQKLVDIQILQRQNIYRRGITETAVSVIQTRAQTPRPPSRIHHDRLWTKVEKTGK